MKWPFHKLMDGEPGAAGGGAPAGDPPPAGKWYDGFQDQGVKDWLGSYGEAYPNAEAVALKALNLEKFIGADKSGRGVIAPKPDAKPEEWQEFYRKVGGVPDKADGYKVPADMAGDAMINKFREHALKSGMPPMFFDAAVNWYTAEMKGMAQGAIDAAARQSEQDLADLKSEWVGVEYDKNVELGRRAARQFIPHQNAAELEQTLAKLEDALGTKGMMKMFASIGSALGEDQFVDAGGSGGSGGMSGLTPGAARVRISQLKADSEWVAKLAKGDSEARAEWDRLHKVAYSE